MKKVAINWPEEYRRYNAKKASGQKTMRDMLADLTGEIKDEKDYLDALVKVLFRTGNKKVTIVEVEDLVNGALYLQEHMSAPFHISGDEFMEAFDWIDKVWIPENIYKEDTLFPKAHTMLNDIRYALDEDMYTAFTIAEGRVVDHFIFAKKMDPIALIPAAELLQLKGTRVFLQETEAVSHVFGNEKADILNDAEGTRAGIVNHDDRLRLATETEMCEFRKKWLDIDIWKKK